MGLPCLGFGLSQKQSGGNRDKGDEGEKKLRLGNCFSSSCIPVHPRLKAFSFNH